MITGSQRAFINQAIPILRKDTRIVGIALGGSYAKDTMDEYSGLDFIIAAEPESFSALIADSENIAASMGTLLACFPAEHIDKPNHLICLFGDPLIHVDLDFQPLSEISDRLEDPVILYQKDTVMADEYAKKTAHIPTPDLQWYEDRFWIWVHYIANRIARGELFDAIEGLSHLRQNVLGPLMLVKNGRPPWGVRNIEIAAPNELPRIIMTLAEHDAKSCIRALKAAADLYIYLRGLSASKLTNREEAEKRALKYLSVISDKIM